MNIFLVLVKKEIKELLTLQVILSIAAMLVVFQVIGKSVGSQNRSTASRNGLVTVDLDRSALSRRLISALAEAGYEIKPSPAGSIEAALAAPAQAAENSFLLIPAGLERTVNSGIKSRVEFYSRFKKNASGLGPVLAASRTRKAVATVTGELSYHVLERRVPGVPPALLRNPAPALEFAVVDGRAVEVPLSQVVAFIQSQTYFFPVAVFFIVILSAQMIMTSVAGEKENKTLETLLSSPIDRRLLVMSKLAASAVIAAALSAAYMLGMRSFMSGITAETSLGAASGTAAAGPALAKLGLLITPSGYFLIGVSVLFCILCALSIAFILGVLSEDLKSTQAMMTPLMMALMLSYLLPIFIDLSSANFGIKFLLYAIPFTHAFMAPQNMMMGNTAQVLRGIVYQAAIFTVCVFYAARLFSGEDLLTMRLKFGRKK